MSGILDCPECAAHAESAGWSLVGACASVGIERGLTTSQMLARYLRSYHADGHQEKAA